MANEQLQREIPEPIALDVDKSLTVTLSEESIQVGKTWVDRGGIRVTKRVESREQRVEESLLREDVEVERRPVGREVDHVPEVRQEGDTLIYPIVEERLYTEKRLVLVEELRVTRVRRSEPRSDTLTLRKEHIEIERLEPDPKSNANPT